MKTFLVRSTLLSALICIPLAGFSDTLQLKDGWEIIGHYEGGNSRVIRFRTGSGIAEYDILRVSHIRISESASTSSTNQPAGNAFSDLGGSRLSFGPEQERLIRDWFSNRSNLSGLPPGLARRDSLPPGLQRQVQRNGTLPPGLQRRLQPLPSDLERRLPGLLEGWGRVILGRDVLLMDVATAKVVDLLRNVL